MGDLGTRYALALLGASIAMHPRINARKLLMDFDRQIERNFDSGDEIPEPVLELRAAIAKVVAAKKSPA